MKVEVLALSKSKLEKALKQKGIENKWTEDYKVEANNRLVEITPDGGYKIIDGERVVLYDDENKVARYLSKVVEEFTEGQEVAIEDFLKDEKVTDAEYIALETGKSYDEVVSDKELDEYKVMFPGYDIPLYASKDADIQDIYRFMFDVIGFTELPEKVADEFTKYWNELRGVKEDKDVDDQNIEVETEEVVEEPNPEEEGEAPEGGEEAPQDGGIESDLADYFDEFVSLLNDSASAEVEAKKEELGDAPEGWQPPEIVYSKEELTEDDIKEIAAAAYPEGYEFTTLGIEEGQTYIRKEVRREDGTEVTYMIPYVSGCLVISPGVDGLEAVDSGELETAVNDELSSLKEKIGNLYSYAVVDDTEEEEPVQEDEDPSELEEDSLFINLSSYFEDKVKIFKKEDKVIIKKDDRILVVDGDEEPGIAIVVFKGKDAQVQDSVLSHDLDEVFDFIEETLELEEKE